MASKRFVYVETYPGKPNVKVFPDGPLSNALNFAISSAESSKSNNYRTTKLDQITSRACYSHIELYTYINIRTNTFRIYTLRYDSNILLDPIFNKNLCGSFRVTFSNFNDNRIFKQWNRGEGSKNWNKSMLFL